MEQPIKISNLNDFVFCSASIYYHGLYEDLEKSIYQEIDQLRGTMTHGKIDLGEYSTEKGTLQGIEVYSRKYDIIGKIDIYYGNKELLVERKYKIITIYDGYVYQLYAQYFGMVEQGYKIKELKLYSYSDNKSYPIKLPEDDPEMLEKFKRIILDIKTFDLSSFRQSNKDKCRRCIYSQLCVSGGETIC